MLCAPLHGMASIPAASPFLLSRLHSSTFLLRPSSSSALLPVPIASGKVECHGARDLALLRRPPLASSLSPDDYGGADDGDGGGGDAAVAIRGRGRRRNGRRKGEEYAEWEDVILEDTVPLVGFVRMLLFSGMYQSGDKLSPEHEKAIMERVLPHHPEFEKKIGCGIDFITIGFHPEFETSRCLFIVRKDGELVDFSYWKCIKCLIRKKYPLYADTFILRHFQRRRYND